MAQNWLDDCFSTGHVVETDMAQIENNFAALKSLFSGSSAPASPVDFQLWANSSDSIIYYRATGSSWHTMFDCANDRVADGKVDAVSIKTSAILSSNLSATCIKAVAIDGSAITSDKIADGAVEAKFQHTTGTSVTVSYYSLTGNFGINPGYFAYGHFPHGGKMTVYGSAQGQGIRIYRNGSAISTTATGAVQTDVTLNATGGNIISLYNPSCSLAVVSYGLYQGQNGPCAHGWTAALSTVEPPP